MRISDWSSDVCSSDLIIAIPVADFGRRAFHTGSNHLVAVGGARTQAALQLSQRRRQDEDADDVAASLLIKLLRTLPIYVEQDILPIGQHVFDRRARGAVAVAEYMRPFQECAVPRHFPERLLIDEMIVDSVLFTGAHGAGSGRYGHADMAVRIQQDRKSTRLNSSH